MDVDVDSGNAHVCVRAVVAWAFDQVAPAPLATISEKYHTPIVAITVTTIVNLIFMALFVFTPWFSKIVILIEAAVLAWSVAWPLGMFFPYLRPELYEKSPIAGKTHRDRTTLCERRHGRRVQRPVRRDRRT